MEKICVLDKLPSGMHYNTFDCEFNDNKSTILIKSCVLKQRYTCSKAMCLSADNDAVARGLYELNNCLYLFPRSNGSRFTKTVLFL